MNTEINPAFANPLLAETLPSFRPILFSTPMVKAILSWQKKQTRRIIKNVSADDIFYGLEENPELVSKDQIEPDGKIYKGLYAHFEERSVRCPYGKVGDFLWVRETFAETPFSYEYKASAKENWKWKPSLFMPKKACRIFLKIVGISVERIQDINEEDAVKEGMKNDLPEGSAKIDFQFLWLKINGQNSWSDNNFVWVIAFEECSRPEGFR